LLNKLKYTSPARARQKEDARERRG